MTTIQQVDYLLRQARAIEQMDPEFAAYLVQFVQRLTLNEANYSVCPPHQAEPQPLDYREWAKEKE